MLRVNPGTQYKILVPFLLDLGTFHGPYYNSFGDGYPATLLLGLRTLLLDLRTLLLDLALPQTTPPLDRFSKLRPDRNSSNSRGLELRYHATWQEALQYIVWFSASFPFCPLLNSYFSRLFRPFSVTQELNLVSTWVKMPHLDIFIWLQYLNFPPCASHQTSYISCIHWASISILPP